MVTFVEDICEFYNIHSNLLSIGCGHGLNEIFMSEMCDNVKNILGIDLNKIRIGSMNKIKGILGIKDVVGIHDDGKALECQNETFGCVIIIEALSHVIDQYQVLKEAVRVLKGMEAYW
jgi:ubiquinone/menaquinone biosynthesis C-methylase UbiE